MPQDQIAYSDKYYDEQYEYRFDGHTFLISLVNDHTNDFKCTNMHYLDRTSNTADRSIKNQQSNIFL